MGWYMAVQWQTLTCTGHQQNLQIPWGAVSELRNASISVYCFSKTAIYLLERNSRIGIATRTVADILERLSKTSGNNLYMVSRISSVHKVKADTQAPAQRDASPT
jgi:hypothetical protein